VETQGLSRTLNPVNAYPNPFNAETTLQFVTSLQAVVDLTLYDALGQRVRHWQLHHPGGVGTVHWNGLDMQGRPVATGVYLLGMRTPTEQVTHKLLLVR
jgi:flagellar hook assembly protein FlgD